MKGKEWSLFKPIAISLTRIPVTVNQLNSFASGVMLQAACRDKSNLNQSCNNIQMISTLNFYGCTNLNYFISKCETDIITWFERFSRFTGLYFYSCTVCTTVSYCPHLVWTDRHRKYMQNPTNPHCKHSDLGIKWWISKTFSVKS